jgi:hypothetical protein
MNNTTFPIAVAEATGLLTGAERDQRNGVRGMAVIAQAK